MSNTSLEPAQLKKYLNAIELLVLEIFSRPLKYLLELKLFSKHSLYIYGEEHKIFQSLYQIFEISRKLILQLDVIISILLAELIFFLMIYSM